MAAGLIAAAGIGFAISAVENGIEGAEAYKAKVEELGQEFIDTGKLGEASLDFIIDNLKTMATTTEDGEANLRKLSKLTDSSATSFEDLAQAYGKTTDELRENWREADKLRQTYEEQADAIDQSSASGSKL